MKKDRNYWKERLPLIQAYVDGHDIKYKDECTCYGQGLGLEGDLKEYVIIPRQDPFAKLKQAHAQGKTIQFFACSSQEWKDLCCPSWDSRYHYRIKPERKLVRFTEDDFPLFIDKWWKHKQHGTPRKVTAYNNYGVIMIGPETTNYDYFLEWFVDEDNNPAGKWVEQ